MSLILPRPYLEENEPHEPQWHEGRREPGAKPVIVAHTSEGGPSATARGLASFIQGRRDSGSYHLVGDEDSIEYLIDFDNEAFGDRTGSNRYAVHVALAMDAIEWGTAGPRRLENLADTFGQMVAIVADYFEAEGLLDNAPDIVQFGWPTESTTSPGVTSHAKRDPFRRTDPGKWFPWNGARLEAKHYIEHPHLIDKLKRGAPMPTRNRQDRVDGLIDKLKQGAPMPTQNRRNEHVAALQQWLVDQGLASINEASYIDGIIGPVTTTDLLAVLNTKPGQSEAFETWVDAHRDMARARKIIDENQNVLSNMIETVTRGV